MRATFPRLANYYLRGYISDADALALAKWDVLILATTEQVISQIPKIRAANPDVTILAYVGCAYTIYNLPDVRDPNVWFWQDVRDAANAHNWWLLRADYSHAWSWKPEYWLLNPTIGYQKWLPSYITDELFVQRPGIYDGVMLDNLWDRISFVNSGRASGVSLSSDGVATPAPQLDAGWRGGMSVLCTELRWLLGPDRIIVGNGASSYPEANGAVIEDAFRNFSGTETPLLWRDWVLPGYPYSLARNNAFYAPTRVNIVNAGHPQFDGSPEQDRRLRFTLGSCLLFDAWFSFDRSPDNHAQLWWSPLYDIELGQAQGEFYPGTGHATGLYIRSFERGVVRVNPTSLAILKVRPMDAVIG